MPSPLTLQPLGPHLGAEVLDLDPATVFQPQTLAALEAALVKHEALVLHAPWQIQQQAQILLAYCHQYRWILVAQSNHHNGRLHKQSLGYQACRSPTQKPFCYNNQDRVLSVD